MHPSTAAVLAALLVAPFAAGPAAAADGLAKCEAQLAASPFGQAPARCFYDLAISRPPSPRAAHRLADLRLQRLDNPWFALYLGRLRWSEDRTGVEPLYRQAADIAAERSDAAAEVAARAGLARLLRDAGRLDEADREAGRVRATAERSGEPALLAHARMLEAQQAISRGEHLERAWEALAGLDEALLPDPALRRECQLARADVAYRTGRYREAREAQRRLAEAAAAEGNRAWEATALLMGALYRWDEQRDLPAPDGKPELLRLAGEAASVAHAAGAPDTEAYALWLAGSLAGDEGRRQLERCFELARPDWLRSYCRSALARSLAARDPARAAAAIDEAQALAARSGQVWPRISGWNARMRVSWAIGPRERALADALSALDGIEALRDQQAGTASQPGLFATWTEGFYWLSGRLLESDLPDSLERGFGVVERMRSRTLMDTLEAEKGDAEPAEIATLEQLRRGLAGDEALLSFQVAPWQDVAGEPAGGSWLLASTRESTRLYRLPGRAEVRAETGLFGGLFSRRDGAEEEAAGILYRHLLASAVANLPPAIEKLTLIPDDALHRLPFAALRVEAAGGREAGPLATRYRLGLAPSATLWLRLRRAPPRPTLLPALVLADPSFAAEPAVAAGAPPAPAPALPFSRREARAVLRHLGGGSEARLGDEASEALVKAALVKTTPSSRFGLLHFATHAVADAVEPERSYVLLAPGDPAEDGRLEAREIAGLDLEGSVVVLSSCSTGSGAVLSGEGVMSLGRAFFQAGARTVVATLWPLRDDDGAALFECFYRHLARGETVAAALTAAQRERLAAGAPAEAWAGAVVLGDGDAVPLPGGRPWLARERNGMWVGVVLMVLFTLAILGWRRRRRP